MSYFDMLACFIELVIQCNVTLIDHTTTEWISNWMSNSFESIHCSYLFISITLTLWSKWRLLLFFFFLLLHLYFYYWYSKQLNSFQYQHTSTTDHHLTVKLLNSTDKLVTAYDYIIIIIIIIISINVELIN